ncbi:prevent-host-death protein [Ligilactobacillus ruminis]|nr:prevent-host-death protein [Ligilactobacillus ruminis]
MIKIRAVMARIFLILGGAPRFHSNFTDKVPILADLSVSKTRFTDKPSFFGDLSVNFWSL